MVFSSVVFTFIFLPVVLLIYYIAKDRYKNTILLVASLCFYSCSGIQALIIMLISISINYLIGLAIGKSNEKNKCNILLVIDVAINLGILFYFKYLDYTLSVYSILSKTEIEIPNIVLPIGISFFTFQAISYVVDVYRKEVPPEKNILVVGLYIAFFPQLVAGPIIRYKTIAEQFKNRSFSSDLFEKGTKRYLCGFCKKIILANNLALVADRAFSYQNYNELSVALAWIGSIAFSLQIFLDFSSYSDMAIGLANMFGFQLQENFNYPYISKNITEFWRRWHISLSQWFRDYVYIPLGGSRVTVSRNIFNLFVVWSLTGLWHGASITFLIWGMIYFCFLVFEKFVLKPETRGKFTKILWQIITLFVINFAWVVFNIRSLHEVILYLRAMLRMSNNILIDGITHETLNQYGVFILAGIILSTPIVNCMKKKISIFKWEEYIQMYIIPILYIFLFLWAVSFLILGAHNPFIYFNF